MAVWPASLPASLPMDVDEKREPNVIRSDNNAIAKHRKRFTVVPTMIQVPAGKWLFSGTQLDTLTSFFEDDLSYGALSFTWYEPTRHLDGSRTVRFVTPPVHKLIRPHSDPSARRYIVTCDLEVLP